MKRIIALLMAVSMLAAAAACSSAEVRQDETDAGSMVIPDADETESEKTAYDLLKTEKYNDADFVFMAACEGWLDSYYTEDTGDILDTEKYKMHLDIEERYGVKFSFTEYNGQSAGVEAVKNALFQSVAAGSKDFDAAIGEIFHLYIRTLDDVFYDLNKTDIDFSSDWWLEFINSDLSIANRQLCAAGYYGLTGISQNVVLYFNTKLANNYNIGNVYEMVDNGSWTIDRFMELTSGVTDDINGDGKLVLLDDITGVTGAAAYFARTSISMGHSFVSRDDEGKITLSETSEKLVDIHDKLHKIISDNLIDDTYTQFEPAFVGDHSLFLITYLKSISSALREMDDFGVVPVFKYNDDQKEYITSSEPDIIAILKLVKDENMSADIINALTCYSYVYLKDVYLDICFKNKYSRDEDTNRMLNIILANPALDYTLATADMFAGNFFYSTVWQDNITSFIKSQSKGMQRNLDALYDMVSGFDF